MRMQFDALIFIVDSHPGFSAFSFAVIVSVSNFDFLKDFGLRRRGGGKVREVFEAHEGGSLKDGHILLAATDCVSAFDKVLPNSEMRGKGVVLTKMSLFWFQETESIAPNHRHGINGKHWPKNLDPADERVRGRVIVARKASPLPIECVVRGFLAGMAWREYQKTGGVCGIPLPEGLAESEELPNPIFTPATKAKTGRDKNIAFDEVVEICGGETAERIRDYSLKLYKHASAFAREKGVLIADTKFEFGRARDGGLMLIDEAFTPDSSRFWSADEYQAGKPQDSFDKQIVRDYLEKTGWDKKSPAPMLPVDIIEKTRARYIEVYERLTGKPFYDFYGIDV